jgi:hypothetical protein
MAQRAGLIVINILGVSDAVIQRYDVASFMLLPSVHLRRHGAGVETQVLNAPRTPANLRKIELLSSAKREDGIL